MTKELVAEAGDLLNTINGRIGIMVLGEQLSDTVKRYSDFARLFLPLASHEHLLSAWPMLYKEVITVPGDFIEVLGPERCRKVEGSTPPTCEIVTGREKLEEWGKERLEYYGMWIYHLLKKTLDGHGAFSLFFKDITDRDFAKILAWFPVQWTARCIRLVIRLSYFKTVALEDK